MRRAASIAFVIVVLLSALCADDKKKNKYVMNTNTDQWVELARVDDVRAEQPCANWAWAAGLETSLRRQHVEDFNQRYWVLKLNGGLPCLSSAGDFEVLKKKIDGDYYLRDGSHIQLEVRYRESLPETTDGLLLPLAKGRPYMLWWKGQPYVVKGATWDEFIYQTGQKLIEIKTLKLINTSAAGKSSEVIFDREKDDTNDLGAMFDVVVTKLDNDPWKAPHNPAMDPIQQPEPVKK